ncbi:MAG: hypothetical protein EBR82_12010 [Caulobacteraceae bacterium]|nr:hypothetical protein [Caulobacteraceae bacterium]
MLDFKLVMHNEQPKRRIVTVTEDKISLMIELAVSDALQTHEKKMFHRIDEKFNQLNETIKSAFPSGDVHGHRVAHEKENEQKEGWKKLKAELLSKFLSAGLWVATGWLAYSIWQSFKHEVLK